MNHINKIILHPEMVRSPPVINFYLSFFICKSYLIFILLMQKHKLVGDLHLSIMLSKLFILLNKNLIIRIYIFLRTILVILISVSIIIFITLNIISLMFVILNNLTFSLRENNRIFCIKNIFINNITRVLMILKKFFFMDVWNCYWRT